MKKQQGFNIYNELKKCKTIDDLIGKNGLLQNFIGGMIEKLLEQEMDKHLGYNKHNTKGYLSGNSRNGCTIKKINCFYGSLNISVPRDRNGTFDPKLIKKRQRNINSFDEKIISLSAKGMTTRNIQEHVLELYGAKISPTMVSNITQKVTFAAQEWQSRPLEKIYPMVFLDAIHYKIKKNGKTLSKAIYTCLGVKMDGKKEILGLWVGKNETANSWLHICSELKQRGVKDIFIACTDGFKELTHAINKIFPTTQIQRCIIRLIKNSIKNVPHKQSKEFLIDLKKIYKAFSLSAAENSLLNFQKKWESCYPLAIKSWIKSWKNIKTFFQFPEEIRKLIYTTNAIEHLHKQLKKVTNNRSVFPSDQVLFKVIFLTVRNVSQKWTLPVEGWKHARSHFAVMYGKKL